jgi:hypothetical protein
MMPIENRDLPVGIRLEANYKKTRYICVVEAEEDGKLAFVLEDGKRFKSPSSAASAVMGGSAANGWRFWAVEGDAPATAPATEKPAAAKKEKAFKLLRRLPGTALEEGRPRAQGGVREGGGTRRIDRSPQSRAGLFGGLSRGDTMARS